MFLKNLRKTLFLLLLLISSLLPSITLAISISDLNPISHWTCDEVSGTRFDSDITNSNDLTDNNTVLSATGLLNNACDFESTNNEFLTITDANQLNLDLTSSGYSISFWLNPESLGTGYTLLNKFTSGPAGYRIFTDSSNRLNTYWWNTSGDETGIRANSDSFSGTGTWVHFVISVDPTLANKGIRFYKNGSEITATT